MLVVCCGMQRSGSTLQYQIACGIVESLGLGLGIGWDWTNVNAEMASADRPIHVVKVHQPNPDLEATLSMEHTRYIYCHRDIRDVIVSLMDKFGPLDDAAIVRHLHEYILQPYEHFSRRPGTLVSRYETFRDDILMEVGRIERTMGVQLSIEQRTGLARRLSFDEQRAYVSAADWSGGRKWDDRTLLHPNHLADGRSGKWQERLSARQVELIERHVGPWLRAHGYS